MNRIAGQSLDSYFGELPETFIWSDKISHNGIRVLAVLYARWTKKFWPILTNEEIAELSGLSAATIKREVSALRKLGLIKVIRTKEGNRYELIKVEFAGDTYRGRNVVSREAHSKVFIAMTARSISSGALRLWLMLDRIGRTHEWVFSSQSALAKYMGVKERQIRAYLDELKEASLLESRRPDPLGKNEYRLIRTPIMVKAAEEYDEKEEQRKSTLRVYHTWLKSVLSEDIQPTWYAENKELAWSIYAAIHEAVRLMGEEATAELVDETLKTYGHDYPADFIVKILDEWLTELGFEYDESEDGSEETDAA
ncbi:hypothetical protein OHA25_56555 [Nonomuraea sp. NBC_00507]|uniref:helix-turn-helix domain-containing protein n=1 Tax=Nonomuraea sp. NBC_00507 TaxID=2976002 RepID=UPI002E19C0D6